MVEITKKLSMDVARQGYVPTITAKQFDKGSRFLRIRLTNEGKDIYVNPYALVMILAKRSDGTANAFAGEVNGDGTVTVPLTYWMLELAGRVRCSVSVTDEDGRKLSSIGFSVDVKRAEHAGDEIIEDEGRDVLSTLILEVQALRGDYMTRTKNVLDETTLTFGMIEDDGSVSASKRYLYSKKMLVTAGKNLIFRAGEDACGVRKIAFYNGDTLLYVLSFGGNSHAIRTAEIPETATHAVFCVGRCMEKKMVIEGNVLPTEMQEYGVYKVNAVNLNDETGYLDRKNIGINPVIPYGWCETQIEVEYTADTGEIPNLLEGVDIESGKLISASGAEVTSANYSLTDYIPISKDIYLAFLCSTADQYNAFGHWMIYDGNKNFIMRNEVSYVADVLTVKIDHTELEDTDDEGYVRFSIGKNANAAELKIVSGSTAEEALAAYNNEGTGQLVPTGGLAFTRPTPASPEQLAKFMTKLDKLAEKSDGYITSSVLGKDATDTYDIKCYTLTPPTDQGYMQKNLPTIILVAGLHGYEWASQFASYCLMEDLSQNYASSDYLFYLRNNVKFIIVPTANPYGYANGTYKNGRDVNINRNFSYGFDDEVYASTEQGYGGTEAFTEAETTYIKRLIDENADAFCFIDFHCNNDAYQNQNWSQVAWHSLTTDIQSDAIEFAAAATIAGVTSRIAKSDWTTAAAGDCGYISHNTGSGMSKSYAAKQGMLSICVEACERFPTDDGMYEIHVQRLNAELIENLIINILRFCKDLE